jgi:hypothetical protein
MQRPKYVVNKNIAATSTVRLIEAIQPPKEDEGPKVILKPKNAKKLRPGTKLLIKMGKDREKEKERRRAIAAPTIDQAAVEEAIEGIFQDLDL